MIVITYTDRSGKLLKHTVPGYLARDDDNDIVDKATMGERLWMNQLGVCIKPKGATRTRFLIPWHRVYEITFPEPTKNR